MEIDTSKLTLSQVKLKLIKMMFDKSNIVDVVSLHHGSVYYAWREGDFAKIPPNKQQQEEERRKKNNKEKLK